jgi:hypothetical protein
MNIQILDMKFPKEGIKYVVGPGWEKIAGVYSIRNGGWMLVKLE